MSKHSRGLFYNLRFYVLCVLFLLSAAIPLYLSVTVQSDRVVWLRTVQLYGYVSILLLYSALLISAWTSALKKNGPLAKTIKFSRRAIGVGAAYYAALHIIVSYVFQIKNIDTLSALPTVYLVSLFIGALGFTILVLLTVTSLDVAIREMGFSAWKWLHRTVYIGGIFILIHVWMIGSYAAQTSVIVMSFMLLSLLFGFESVRLTRSIANLLRIEGRDYKLIIAISVWALLLSGLVAISATAKSHHHAEHEGSIGLRVNHE